ncbi:MAG: EAL domain-containing protein, partial [Sulfurimonas sp.]
MAKLENYLTQIAELYENSDEDRRSSIVTFLERALNSKNEINMEIDEVSALPNRESMMREISLLQDEAMLVILHINQIEAVKQLYGFEMVQEIISNKAQTLKELIKDNDASLYSINLQKFAILVKNSKLFDKYISILKFSIFNNIESFTYTSSDGSKIVSDFTAGISYGIEHLHHSANVALQEAMVSKLPYKVYEMTPECTTLKKSSLDKYQVYKEALHNGYIVPYFQPIIDANDGSVMKYEALARLQLPDGRVVPPYDFLNIAIEDKTFEFFTRQMMQ